MGDAYGSDDPLGPYRKILKALDGQSSVAGDGTHGIRVDPIIAATCLVDLGSSMWAGSGQAKDLMEMHKAAATQCSGLVQELDAGLLQLADIQMTGMDTPKLQVEMTGIYDTVNCALRSWSEWMESEACKDVPHEVSSAGTCTVETAEALREELETIRKGVAKAQRAVQADIEKRAQTYLDNATLAGVADVTMAVISVFSTFWALQENQGVLNVKDGELEGMKEELKGLKKRLTELLELIAQANKVPSWTEHGVTIAFLLLDTHDVHDRLEKLVRELQSRADGAAGRRGSHVMMLLISGARAYFQHGQARALGALVDRAWQPCCLSAAGAGLHGAGAIAAHVDFTNLSCRLEQSKTCLAQGKSLLSKCQSLKDMMKPAA